MFGCAQFLATFQTYITARPCEQNEPFELYAAELSMLVDEAFPKYGAEAKQGELFRRFVAGLDSSLQLKIHEHGATTMDSALKIASQCERAQLALNINSPSPLMSLTAASQLSLAPPIPSPLTELSTAISDMRAELKDIKRHQARQTDKRLDHLADQFAKLQCAVTSVYKNTTPQHAYYSPRSEDRYRNDRSYAPRRDNDDNYDRRPAAS